jgi:acyl-coenzyme A synthetase/AMP-(fatty) acid ligase
VNFTRDVVDAAPADAPALIELTRDGERRVWAFGELGDASARFAGHLHGQGLRRGDVVLIWLGNRVEWVLAMLACFRLGLIAGACPEQLRSRDLRQRVDAVSPALLIADHRNRDELVHAAPTCPVLWVPNDALWRDGARARAAVLDAHDPCLLSFTSGTSGVPRAVLHNQRYLNGQRLQAEHWLGARGGDVAWCTASSGWSKSARNSFVAPWLRRATAVLHDGRFDPEERVYVIKSENVRVLCMAPTEYRMIAKRTRIPRMPTLRSCVAAGEPLDPPVISAWQEATGAVIRDGYGQTETGQLTGLAPGELVKPGSMGRPLPGVRLWIEDGELVADPRTVPTFFHGYFRDAPVPRDEPWRTGDRIEADDGGSLWFRGRTDDIIISAGYRIGPFEVESALTGHPAVEEAAAVPAPDEDRGAVVRAVVVLCEGYEPTPDLKRELQDHVKTHTAPYKYPRQIDFIDQLPKTLSGKVKRAELRGRA